MSEPDVFVVDDDPAVRDSLAMLLETAGYRARCFESGDAFLAQTPQVSEGCVVLDLRMPGMGGLEVQRALAEAGVRLPIIFLTAHGDIPTTVRAIKAGASDFLTKPVEGGELVDRIAAALAQQRQTYALEAAQAADKHRLERLSSREKEVLRHAIHGATNKEIGRTLGISHRTVEFHRSHILEKTGCGSLLELAHLVALLDSAAGEPGR